MKRIIFAFCCMAAFISISWSATIRIPEDYASINAAMEAASHGDEIVISPGIYGGGDILKRVTLRSTFDGKDWSIIENTRIKGTIGVSSTLSPGAVIRGLRIGPDPMPNPPIPINMIGIRSDYAHANIEYCIIENCNNLSGSSGPSQSGGAIKGITGIIQNNILRNNRADGGSAMSGCGGIIRNNVMYNTNGYEVSVKADFATEFSNNTVYSTKNVNATISGKVANNIFWQAGSEKMYISALSATNCVIKGYTGEWKDIITDDPKFVDPANADFHLQSSSPCIDAGLTTGTAKADIVGVQRGLKGTTLLRGDGSGIDIGAFEYKPKPVAVWLPNGGPDEINAGDNLKVAWELETTTAGTAVNLELFNGEYKVADLGSFWNAAGAAESTVKLPTNIPPRATYSIRGISNWNQSYFSNTPFMSIASTFTAIPGRFWSKYL